MKRTILLVICLICGDLTFGQIFDANQNCLGELVVVAEDAQCNNNGYVLVFEDNFSGTALDLAKWKLPYQGVGRDFDDSAEKQWYVNTGNNPYIPIENNIVVNNEVLQLIAKKEIVTGSYINWDLDPPSGVTETIDYTSSQIESQYQFRHGIFEIRCKLPRGKGFWPAFWTFGGDSEWNEIDVFEFWNEEDVFNNFDPSKLSQVMHMNTHYDYQDDGDPEFCSQKYEGPDFSDDFHTFTLV